MANTRQIIEKLTSKGFADTSTGAARKQQVEETEIENLLRTSEDENASLRQRWEFEYGIKFSWVGIFGRNVGCESELMPIIRNLTHVFLHCV